jgi:hypothetical protein
MRVGKWRGVMLAFGLTAILAAAMSRPAAAGLFKHTIPREVLAYDQRTGGPSYAPAIPNGCYAKDPVGCVTGAIQGVAGRVCMLCGKLGCGTCGGLGLCHGKSCGMCGGDGCTHCDGSHMGHGGGLLHCGNGGAGHGAFSHASYGGCAPGGKTLCGPGRSCATAQCASKQCATPVASAPFAGPKACGLCRGKGHFRGRLCGGCGGRGCSTISDPCGACGGRGCGLCLGGGHGKCSHCGGLGCGLCKGKLAGTLLGLLHSHDVKYFVGPGGPVPLTPGYVPYVVATRSPRDYFAFPPFVDIDP